MEDKDIKNIIKDINNKSDLEEEVLKLEEEIFFHENIPSIDEEEKLKIKNMVSQKIDDKRNFKASRKYLKIASITALLIGSMTIMYPVAANIIDKLYNYIPSEGKIVESVGEVYILENPVVENLDKNKVKLENLILDLGNKTITTTVKGIELKEESTIKIGDTTLESDEYSQAGGDGSFTTSYGFSGEFEYKENSNITYTVTSDNGSNVVFNVKLKKIQSISDYKSIGNTDVKNKVAITAMSIQDNNILDVNFIAKVEGKDTDVYSYGREFYKDEYDTGVVLRDSNGKTVKGKLIHHGDRGNNFQFDTTNLIKPYTIEIPSVTLDMYGVLEGEEIKLDLPDEKNGNLNKEIILKGSNPLILSKNDKVVIKSIESIGEGEYKINFEYPKNDSSEFKISNLSVNASKNILSGKRDFTGYSSDFNVDTEVLDSVTFEVENKTKKTVKFKLYPKNYKVEGNWKIITE